MLRDRVMALAYSAIAMSAMYLTTAWLLKRRRNDPQQLLLEAFLALGVAFLTLAVRSHSTHAGTPHLGPGGAALVWVGCRQDRLLPRIFGALLNVAAGCVVATEFDTTVGHLTLPLGGTSGCYS